MFMRALPVCCPGPVVDGSAGSHETPGAFFRLSFEERRLHPLLCTQRHSYITTDTVLQSLRKTLPRSCLAACGRTVILKRRLDHCTTMVRFIPWARVQ